MTEMVIMQVLFIQGGIQMIVSEVVVAILLAVQFNAHSGDAISQPIGVAVIVFICLFVAGFGWSWGPLGWLVPNEIQPLETRSAGQVSTFHSRSDSTMHFNVLISSSMNGKMHAPE